jgi:SPOR domain
MADIEYGEAVHRDAPARAIDMAGVANWAGAVISAALIAGLAWWGYQLMVRDVTGVPVVRALEGPMRVAPDDPGGASAQYQGLAVNNVAAVGEAEAPADRLVLAPKPTLLTPEDQPEAALQSLAATTAPAPAGVDLATADPQDAQPATLAAPATTLAQAEPAPASGPDAVDGVVAMDQASLIEATLLQLEDTPSAQAPVARGFDAAATPEAIPASVPGVSRSLRPLVRPAAILVASAATSAATPAVAASTDGAVASAAVSLPAPVSEPAAIEVASVDPSTIPVGTRLVQLGAFDSVEVAKAEWLKIAARFEDFMVGKARVIEKAQSGGEVFYRLRVHGFENLSDARQFCSALLAGQASCIPVVTR